MLDNISPSTDSAFQRESRIGTPPAVTDALHWPVCFRSGQIIYDQGEPSVAMYRVKTGCVRLQVNGEDGERQIIAFLFPGDLFGFSLEPSQFAAEAVDDVILDYFPARAVLNLSLSSTNVLAELMSWANSRYGELAVHAAKINHLPAAERVLWFFNSMAAHGGQSAAAASGMAPMSYRDIADYLNLTPETLSRTLTALEASGLLKRRGRRGFSLFQPPVQPSGTISIV